MKVFVILSALLVVASAVGDAVENPSNGTPETSGKCSNKIKSFCTSTTTTKFSQCTSKYEFSQFPQSSLQNYAQTLIGKSFNYLMMSMQFANFQDNREGFQTYFRKLSDQAWEDAIDLIKYITKRGGEMEFKLNKIKVDKHYRLTELESLGKAMDIEKELAKDAAHIYDNELQSTGKRNHADGSTIYYLEKKFLKPQTERIRNLAGHVNDLGQLLQVENPSVSLFIFDEYLKKSL